MIDRAHLAKMMKKEEQRYLARTKKSAKLFAQAKKSMPGGVPMSWMTKWPGAYPLFVKSAKGAHFKDVDGNSYIDFCLGDTGSMTGHSPAATVEAIKKQLSSGLTAMLPTEDALAVSQDLSARFGLPMWQFTVSATDANRHSIRYCRLVTGKQKIIVIDKCYHGSVDETLVILNDKSETVSRPGAIGPQVDPSMTTRAVPFNDLAALEAAFTVGDVACLLIEPALTNIGIVLPLDGYIAGIRELTRKYDVLLIVDETHTICAGPGGCTKLWGIDPDFVVIGKTIGGGIPVAAYGMSADIAHKVENLMHGHDLDVSGIGGTLSGSALAGAAIRATLTHALRQEDFDVAIPLATRWSEGVQNVINQYQLPWTVQQLGCRAEYWFSEHPQNGAQAAASVNDVLESYMHIYALNRGILLTPFHNMALMTPFHSEADVDLHTSVFTACVQELLS